MDVHFHCPKNDLLEGIMTVQKAIASKSTLPILEGIYIETVKDVLKLVGTDLDLGIESYINAEIMKEGKIVLPGRLFSEIIRKLPEGEVELRMEDDHSVVIQCQHSRTTLQGLPADEYPELPKVVEDNPLEISQDLFKDMIRQTIFAVAVDETRPILTGALLEINGQEVNLVALDGYRLALRRGLLDKNSGSKRTVIPGKSLNEISRILGSSEDPISITIANNHILVDMGYTRIISRILEGEFINYRQILPEEFQTRVKIERATLLDSIERASLVAREGKNNLIKFSLQEDKMIITSNSESGQVYEEVPHSLEGKELEIAFNAKYFTDVLKNLDDEYIYMDFNSSVSPCIMKPIDGNGFLYLILPVRIYGN